MTIADYPTFHALPRTKVVYEAHGLASLAGRPQSGWIQQTVAGAVPTTAQACGRSTIGAICVPAQTTTRLVEMAFASTSGQFFRIAGVMVDRLSHQGGLVANIATPQTTNLPTAALPRYTDGEGVWIALEIYATLGATEVTATVSYTNQAGTAGRTGLCRIGGTGAYQARYLMVFVQLQAGDTGVRSVQSVTLSATTGTAGSFGVTLFKPLSWFVALPGLGATSVWVNSFGGCMALPPIDPDACLMPVFFVPSSSSGIRAELSFVEG